MDGENRVIDMARRLPVRYRDYSLEGVATTGGFEYVRAYIEGMQGHIIDGIGLALFGPNGVGKSGALAVAHMHFAEQNPRWGSHRTMWTSARDVATQYGYFFTDSTFDEPVDELLTEAKWLVIDELGREQGVRNHVDRIHALLSKRRDNKVCTSFATNLSPEGVLKVYGEGVFSLIHEVCQLVVLSGTDRRRGT